MVKFNIKAFAIHFHRDGGISAIDECNDSVALGSFTFQIHLIAHRLPGHLQV